MKLRPISFTTMLCLFVLAACLYGFAEKAFAARACGIEGSGVEIASARASSTNACLWAANMQAGFDRANPRGWTWHGWHCAVQRSRPSRDAQEGDFDELVTDWFSCRRGREWINVTTRWEE